MSDAEEIGCEEFHIDPRAAYGPSDTRSAPCPGMWHVVLGVSLVQLLSGAAASSLELALDTDGDASTGCATDLGDSESPNVQPGFEVRLEVFSDAIFPAPRVGAIELVRCVSRAWA